MVKEELASGGEDPRPEMAMLQKRFKEIDAKADQLLEMMTPENQDFVDRKLASLRRERKEVEAQLEDLAGLDFKPPDVEATVDAILAQLKDFPRIAAQGTQEERKQFVRAFVEGIKIDPRESAGAIQITAIPLPNTSPYDFPLEIDAHM